MSGKPNQSGENDSSLVTHRNYWIKGGDLHLLLGQTLYRIHSHFFLRESKYWKTKLIGSNDGPLLQGSTSINALVLEEKPADFECLLEIFYNRRFGDYSHLELAQWIAVFGYSIKWEFPQVKELAIRYIIAFEMDTIERIVLYRDTRLPKKYLLPLYMQIASREELLNLEESKRLGFDTLVCIHQARECLRSQVPINNRLLSPVRTDLKRTEVINIVASTFNISLTDASFDSGSDSNA